MSYRDEEAATRVRIELLTQDLDDSRALARRLSNENLKLSAEVARLTEELQKLRPATPVTVRVANPNLVFEVTEPDGTQREIRLNTPVAKIGRAPSAHVHLDHPDVARMHAVVESDVDGARIVDLGSASGTFVNEERVNTSALRTGDTITISGVQLVVWLHPAGS